MHERSWVLGLAILALSGAAPLIKAAHPVAPLAIAALRIGLAAVVLAIVSGAELRALAEVPRRQRRGIVVAGLLLGVHFGVWITSLSFTSTAASTSLVATNPVFAALFGVALGDRVARREWFGIALAVVGCAVLAGGDWGAGGDAVFGDLLAVAGAAAGAGYLVVGRSLRAEIPLFPYLAAVNAVAAAGLLVAALVAEVPLTGGPAGAYAAIAASALIASVGGHTLLNRAVRYTPAHLVALAILGEPIGASLLSWILLGERPPGLAAVGGAIILIGIAVGFVRMPPPKRRR